MALIPVGVLLENAEKFKSKIVESIVESPITRMGNALPSIHRRLEPRLPSILSRTSGLVGGRPRMVGLSKLTGGAQKLGSLESSLGEASTTTKGGVLGSLESMGARLTERLKAARGDHLAAAKAIKFEADIFSGEAGPLSKKLQKQVEQAFNTYVEGAEPGLSRLDALLQANAQRAAERPWKLETLKWEAISKEQTRLQGVPEAEWPHWARRERRLKMQRDAKQNIEHRRREGLGEWKSFLNWGADNLQESPAYPTMARSDIGSGSAGLAVHQLGYTSKSGDIETILENAKGVQGMLGLGSTLCATPRPYTDGGPGLVIRGNIVEKFPLDVWSARLPSGERVANPHLRARKNEDWWEGWIRPKEIVGVVPGRTPGEAEQVSQLLGAPLISRREDGSFDWGGLVSSDEARQLNRRKQTRDYKRVLPSMSEIMGFDI